MTVQALIFDVDGVLVEPWGFAHYLKREYPQIAEQTQELFRGVFGACLIGQADLRAELPPYLAKWGWPHSLDDFLQIWFDSEREVDARLLAAITSARANGIRCYLATNQERYRVEYIREQMNFGTLVDGIYSSAHLGIKKPEAAFFQAITEDLGILADQIMFWDDSQANVDAARAHGWQAELYTEYALFYEQFRRLTGVDDNL
jgi:putative hydrolase of the HAD superfamily